MRKLISAAVLAAALVCVPIALAASSPIVSAGATTGIGQTSATLHGTVNPNGPATTYQFHYGPTSALGSLSPTTAASAGAGTAGVAVATKLTGLSPDTTYYFQLVASNSAGTSSTVDRIVQDDRQPGADDDHEPAVDVSRYGATLVGTINPNNQATAYHFEFGLTTRTGSSPPRRRFPPVAPRSRSGPAARPRAGAGLPLPPGRRPRLHVGHLRRRHDVPDAPVAAAAHEATVVGQDRDRSKRAVRVHDARHASLTARRSRPATAARNGDDQVLDGSRTLVTAHRAGWFDHVHLPLGVPLCPHPGQRSHEADREGALSRRRVGRAGGTSATIRAR